MPILTSDNLATRARQARFAIDRCTTPPTSIGELKTRIVARPNPSGTAAAAYVFGPVARSGWVTSYGPHFALGVADYESGSSFASIGSEGLRTIEQTLVDLLKEFPVESGHDVVFATIPATGEMWQAGLKADYQLRECHARARRAALSEGLRHVWYARGV